MRLPCACLAFALALAAQSPPAPAPTPAPTPDLATRLDALCQPLLDADLVVGFVVGVLDGDTTLIRGYGAVARGGGVPDGDTVFEIGSVSKVFTGLLLADSVQRGVVALDDPIAKHLPAGTTIPAWEDEPVRLWHLSTHTSGLPRLPGMQGSDPADPYAHFTDERVLAALAKVRVRWQPGSKYEYSNLAVGLLGLALTRANGAASYADLLRTRVTAPLRMADTMVALDDAHRARFASPHDADGEPAHAWDLGALAGAGGIRSTVRDMLRFLDVQRAPGDSPLAAAIALQQKKHHDGQNGIALGLGWHFARDGQTRWHNGETGGFHAYTAVVPQSRRAVCILANTARGEIDQLGERIVQMLYGQRVAPPKVEKPAVVAREVLQKLVGEYRMNLLAKFTVTLGERGLSAQLTGQPASRLFPRSATEFFYRAVEASITFELAGDDVKALVLHQNGQDVRCERIAAKKPQKQ